MFRIFETIFGPYILIFDLILLNKRDSFCLIDSKNGLTFENPIIGLGDIGLNMRDHEFINH